MPSRPKAVRLAANLSTLFQDLPFEQRASAAARCGFAGLEVQYPYELAATSVLFERALSRAGLPLVLLNTPRGESGEPGVASLPDRRAEFLEGVARAAEYAHGVSCPLVHVMAGRGGDRQCYLDNLAHAVDVLRPAGASVVIEVLNNVDVPGYHLRSTADALSVLEAVPGVGLQHDLYHSARAGDNVAATLRAMAAPPAHLQLSSVPNRHEPDESMIAWMLLAIELGYSGFVGCEYWPRAETEAGLGWASGLLADPPTPIVASS